MAKEIERKFLVRDASWRAGAAGVAYRQGYLALEPRCTVRVRTGGGRAWLTVKGRAVGITRDEYEYEIPAAEADDMLGALCAGAVIEKTRYRVTHAGLTWEVDEFHGANAGLVVAEVELDDEEARVEVPPWAGAEVTHDRRYTNAALAQHPYSRWGAA